MFALPAPLRRRLSRLVRSAAFRALAPVLRRLRLRDVNLLGCTIRVAPGVFHPGLYFSTKLLAKHLLRMELAGKFLLDMGTGSGILGILAAKQGAQVIAVDINPEAVATARRNASENGVADRFAAVHGDLFCQIPPEKIFDVIVFNPPFYPRAAANDEDRAWAAGEDHETLRVFFRETPPFLDLSGQVVIILSSDVDLNEMARIATGAGFVLSRETEIPHLFETFVIREYRFQQPAITSQPEEGIPDL